MHRINKSICAVVPVYNSQSTLPALAGSLIKVLSCFSKYRIILVDDFSADNSFEIIQDLCEKHESIIGIKLSRNFGQQSALFCGLHYADYDYTVIIDDDFEQNPKDIFALFSEIEKGYSAVYGINRQSGKKNFIRRMGTKARDSLFNSITTIPKGIKVCSYRIMTRKTVDNILKAETVFVYISLEILKHTANISNVFVEYDKPAKSHYHVLKLFFLLIKMYIYYADKTFLIKLRKKGKCYDIEKITSKGLDV